VQSRFAELGDLQEMDANLEYMHFLVSLERQHPLRQRFFQVIGDYPEPITWKNDEAGSHHL
jgi:hypothetical protein